MRICNFSENNIQALYDLYEDAFGKKDGSIIGKLVDQLLYDLDARPIVSLVEEEAGEILGHVLFTSANIVGYDNLSVSVMAPLAVFKSHQGKGIGTRLINRGLEILKEEGTALVMVLGNPNYYSRLGFKSGHAIRAPYELDYPDAWMAKTLMPLPLSEIRGKIVCAKSLLKLEGW